MIEVVENYLDNVFNSLPQTEEVLKAKRDLFDVMEEKFYDLKSDGKTDSDAFAIVIAEFGNIEEILDDLDLEEENNEEKQDSESKKGRESADKFKIHVDKDGNVDGMFGGIDINVDAETEEVQVDLNNLGEDIKNQLSQTRETIKKQVEDIQKEVEETVKQSTKHTKREKSIFDEEEKYSEPVKTTVKVESGKTKKIFGIILLFVAAYAALSMVFDYHFTIFFAGWWTLFLIIPGLIGVVKGEGKTGSFIILAVGIILLFGSYVNNSWMWSAFFIVLIAMAGLRMIFGKNKVIEIDTRQYADGDSCIAVFGSNEVDFSKEVFTADRRIDCVAVFGAIDVIAPKNVKVISNGVSVLGSADNNAKDNEGEYTLYIDYVCVFGGMDIY